MSSIAETLNSWREVQNSPMGPNFCLGSSKFFAGKLIGLFDPASHVNHFHNSTWRKGHGSEWESKVAWGKLAGEADFNRRVLPAALRDPAAGVRNPDGHWKHVEFHHFYGHERWADALLLGRVPLIVGVNHLGGVGLDHYITVLRSKDFKVWAVDSWGESEWKSVVELPMDFSFLDPKRFEMNVSGGEGTTRIPSSPAYFGFYRDTVSKAAIGISRMI